MNHKRIITELAACEDKLDTVLFSTGDMAAGAGLGITGIGTAGYLYGRKGMKKKQTWGAKDIGGTVGRGLGRGASDLGKSAKSIWASILKRIPK